MGDIGSTIQKLRIGETVAYSEAFLDRNGQYASNMANLLSAISATATLKRMVTARWRPTHFEASTATSGA